MRPAIKPISGASPWRPLAHEVFLVGRFAIVGLVATGVHMFTVWALIEWRGVAPLRANFAAFLAAFSVSFTGHYLWTFSAPGSSVRALLRFLLVSGTAFLFNTALLAFLLEEGWMSPPIAAVLAAGVVPVVTFLASRVWVFRPMGQAQVGAKRAKDCSLPESESAP